MWVSVRHAIESKASPAIQKTHAVEKNSKTKRNTYRKAVKPCRTWEHVFAKANEPTQRNERRYRELFAWLYCWHRLEGHIDMLGQIMLLEWQPFRYRIPIVVSLCTLDCTKSSVSPWRASPTARQYQRPNRCTWNFLCVVGMSPWMVRSPLLLSFPPLFLLTLPWHGQQTALTASFSEPPFQRRLVMQQEQVVLFSKQKHCHLYLSI